MIEIENLSRRYGAVTAVDDVSLTIGEGEIFGLLGPNGAGKTSLLRMLPGYLPPTAGRIRLAGIDVLADPLAARRRLGYLPENVQPYPELRVREYLRFSAGLHGLRGAARSQGIDQALERCLLTEVAGQTIGTLSKGYRQRVGLAAAILHRPPVLVLDEPTVGLDPRQIIAIRELVRELARDATLLLSTHILPEVELLCGRVAILDHGRAVAVGSPEELRHRGRAGRRLRLRLLTVPANVMAALETLPAVTRVLAVDGEPGAFDLYAEGELPALEAYRLAAREGWDLVELRPDRATLESVFVQLTTRETFDEVEVSASAMDQLPAAEEGA